MIIKDDRTDQQKADLPWLVIGTDSFLSGWGKAKHGASYAAWACSDGEREACYANIDARQEMKRVRVVHADGYRPSSDHCAHLHIYVWKGEYIRPLGCKPRHRKD